MTETEALTITLLILIAFAAIVLYYFMRKYTDFKETINRVYSLAISIDKVRKDAENEYIRARKLNEETSQAELDALKRFRLITEGMVTVEERTRETKQDIEHIIQTLDEISTKLDK